MYVYVVSLSVLFPQVDQGTGGTPIYIIRQDVTFIFTDQDVINENFLEIMNSILATGEAGLMNLGLKIGYMMIHPSIWDTYCFMINAAMQPDVFETKEEKHCVVFQPYIG